MNNENSVFPMSLENFDDPIKDQEIRSISHKVDVNHSDEHSLVSFESINYTVMIRKNLCGSCRAKESKKILRNVSGIMKPGINAIMGPTGSGKSSLLDILAGRKDQSGLSGQVLINGSPLPPNFKRISGYVVQQDIVVGTLTVRENLWFSANLRLPKSISNEKKKQRIDEILYDLGLTGCADTKVGNELIRGISGGEKKRACIGMELITSPSVLFLDEPTTGLDASTANAVMLLLKRLGNRGRTIILSIHQPRFSIFRLFDSLTLLSLGRLAYHGPYDKVLPYFESLGYHCQEHNNPADFFLDVINGDSTALANSIEDEANSEIPNSFPEESEKDNATLSEQLAMKFEKSDVYSDTQQDLAKLRKEVSFKNAKLSSLDTYATSFPHQFAVLSNRAFKGLIRNPMASIGNLFINIVVAVVFGLLFYQVNDTPTVGSQNRFGVLFFVVTNLMFSSVSAAELFNKERDIFVHEYVSGYYMVVAYFLSKLVADLIPMRTVAPLVFGSITYWMVGLKSDASSFFIFVFFLILICYAATSIALFFSACFSNFALASIFITLTFVFSILFAGLLLNVDSLLSWLAWIRYLSVAQYGLSAISINEFRNQTFTSCAASGSPEVVSCLTLGSAADISTVNNQTCCSVTGEGLVMNSLGLGENGVLTEWDLWQNAVALGCIFTGMLFLTYIQLRRTKTTT